MTNGSALADLAARIAAWTGLDLDRGVHAYVIRDMIRRRAAATGATVDSYAATVHDPSVAEAARLIDAVTVCHSWFNRDPDQLAVIEQQLAAGPADMDI
jgi:chemotaxis methyl-accepting protein methylase